MIVEENYLMNLQKHIFYLFLSNYNLHIYFSLEGEGTLYGGGGNIENIIIKDVKISVFDLIDLLMKIILFTKT